MYIQVTSSTLPPFAPHHCLDLPAIQVRVTTTNSYSHDDRDGGESINLAGREYAALTRKSTRHVSGASMSA
jgi:hypothetical protein